jgi:GNAT superfamily N-acetyltransferase
MNFSYEMINEKHIDAAVKIVMDAYNEERSAIPFLPEGEQFDEALHSKVFRLFTKGMGIAALLDGELAGFISGFKVNELWGRCKGAHSPIYGHGAIKEHRSKLYQELYKRAADLWVKEHITSHALTLFAHDSGSINTWFWLGFGNRCVDSIRQAAPLGMVKSDLYIKKIGQKELFDLAEVQRNLHMYFKDSPMFMQREEENPVECLSHWLKEDNRHLWAAYREGKVVGHMQIQTVGETFVSEHRDVMNITGAYVLDCERKSGVATLLLNAIQNWLLDNGYPLCGVDFESFNTDGSGFWNKYFIPYTHTLTRRIDERIL